MRWIWIGVAVVGVVILGVVGVGMLLPVSHTAVTSRAVQGTPEEVWAAVTGVEAFPEWRPGLETIEALPPRDGRPVWRESGPTGTMTIETVEAEVPTRLVTRIADEDLPFGGTWTYELEPTGDGRTRVTITEDGEVYNPVFRFMARFVFGHTATMDTYLDGLEARMGPGSTGVGEG